LLSLKWAPNSPSLTQRWVAIGLSPFPFLVFSLCVAGLYRCFSYLKRQKEKKIDVGLLYLNLSHHSSKKNFYKGAQWKTVQLMISILFSQENTFDVSYKAYGWNNIIFSSLMQTA